jgi:hypothetical protein
VKLLYFKRLATSDGLDLLRAEVAHAADESLDHRLADQTTVALADSASWQWLLVLQSLLASLEPLHLRLERIAALGWADVLRAHANALAQRTCVHWLVDDNTNAARGHVPDNAGLAVVVLVRHTLAHRWIGNDVNVVTDLVRRQGLGGGWHAMLPELLLEHVARAALVAVGVHHSEIAALALDYSFNLRNET